MCECLVQMFYGSSSFVCASETSQRKLPFSVKVKKALGCFPMASLSFIAWGAMCDRNQSTVTSMQRKHHPTRQEYHRFLCQCCHCCVTCVGTCRSVRYISPSSKWLKQENMKHKLQKYVSCAHINQCSLTFTVKCCQPGRLRQGEPVQRGKQVDPDTFCNQFLVQF